MSATGLSTPGTVITPTMLSHRTTEPSANAVEANINESTITNRCFILRLLFVFGSGRLDQPVAGSLFSTPSTVIGTVVVQTRFGRTPHDALSCAAGARTTPRPAPKE